MNIGVLDRILVACVDGNPCRIPRFDDPDLQINALVKKFRENKVAVRRLQTFAREQGVDDPHLSAQANEDERWQRNWVTLLRFSSDLFRRERIGHVFTKIFEPTLARMEDVDVLIADPQEELRALQVLHLQGYRFWQFRLLAHPLKIMATSNVTPEERIPIDIYPGALWIRKKVCDGPIILHRKRLASINGIKTIVPSAEDDFYLVATHAYSHFRFTLVEILHGVELIRKERKFDWEYLFNLGRTYGCLDSTFFYIRLIDTYTKVFHGCSPIADDVLDLYGHEGVCRKVESYFLHNHDKQFIFPCTVPKWLAVVRSSLYHCTTMLGHVPMKDLCSDFLSHYLALSADVLHV